MKSMISTAAVAAITFNQAEAFGFDDVSNFLSKIPMSKHEAPGHYTNKLRAPKVQRTEAHKQRTMEAIHRTQATRARLGKPRIAAGTTDDENGYENLTGLLGYTLGSINGLQYAADERSECFVAAEGSLVSFDTLLGALSHFYLPYWWSDIQITASDTIAVQSAVFDDCELTKLFNTLTDLASAEGVSELGARAAGAYMFEYKAWTNLRGDPTASSYQRGQTFGKLFSKIADYTIG